MIKSLFPDDEPDKVSDESKPVMAASGDGVLGLVDYDRASPIDEDGDKPEEFVISRSEPESTADTMRRTGMAWSAGVAFFGAVVFMLVIGWGADVMFGSSPWGI